MTDAVGVVLMASVGSLLAAQAPLNRQLSGLVTGVPAALVNFGVGLAAILIVCALVGELGSLPDALEVPAPRLAGGLLGAGFVLAALLCVGAIGAGGVAAAAVTGQLLASLALDAGGAFGLEQRPIDAQSLLGGAAVLAGTVLILPRAVRGEVAEVARWSRLGPAMAVIAGGAMMGVQHPLNGELGASIGDLQAGVVNFVVGTAALGAVVLCTGQARRLGGLRRVRPHQLGGGLIGAVNATAALVLVGEIGAGAIAAAAVTGQMTASLALDRAGLLALRPHPVTGRRLGGGALLVAGTILIVL